MTRQVHRIVSSWHIEVCACTWSVLLTPSLSGWSSNCTAAVSAGADIKEREDGIVPGSGVGGVFTITVGFEKALLR